MDVSEARQTRMRQLIAQRRYLAAVDEVAGRLAALALPVGRDDVVSKEAVQAAHDRLSEQQRFHRQWHRAWGVRLHTEVLATVERLAAVLGDERAVLVWGGDDPVGFLVPLEAALLTLGPQVGPDDADSF